MRANRNVKIRGTTCLASLFSSNRLREQLALKNGFHLLNMNIKMKLNFLTVMFRGIKIKLHYQAKSCPTQLFPPFMAQCFIYY